jgi:hypothetical protein
MIRKVPNPAEVDVRSIIWKMREDLDESSLSS